MMASAFGGGSVVVTDTRVPTVEPVDAVVGEVVAALDAGGETVVMAERAEVDVPAADLVDPPPPQPPRARIATASPQQPRRLFLLLAAKIMASL